MKLLIYAFEPFGRAERNISQQVLEKLRNRKSIKKVVFPVQFNNRSFIKTVQDTKPNVILGLGQYPRGKKIRVERLAINQKKSINQPLRTIMSNGKHKAIVTLKLQPDIASRISYNAGMYVCNYSMYVLLTSHMTKDIPFAFLHIPKGFDMIRATEFVESKIDEILS